MDPQETFVRHFRLGNGTDVVVVVARAGLTAFAVARGHALVDKLPAHQRIYFDDLRRRARHRPGAIPH